MLPEFGLGTTLAYNALHEQDEQAEKIEQSRKALKVQNRQLRRNRLGNLFISFGMWVAKPETGKPEMNLEK